MKILFDNHNNVLDEIVKLEEFEQVRDIREADKIVLWNDQMPLAETVIEWAHDMGKPVIAVQHGRWGSSRYYEPFNNKIAADALCVWGSNDKFRLVEAGHPAEKIHVVGTTVISGLGERLRHDQPTIVYSPEHWGAEVQENEQCASILRKMKDFKVITKIMEDHDPKLYDNPVFSERGAKDHLLLCYQVLSTADVVVCIAEGTFELMAQAMDIPVVLCDNWKMKPCNGDEKYLKYQRLSSPAVKIARIPKLLETIRQQVANPGELAKERKEVLKTHANIPGEDPVKLIKEIICQTSY